MTEQPVTYYKCQKCGMVMTNDKVIKINGENSCGLCYGKVKVIG